MPFKSLTLLTLTLLILTISSCNKKDNTHAFTVYFYTTTASMPPVYIVKGEKSYGKIPLLKKDMEAIDTTQLHITTYESSTEILAASSKGHVLETFAYDFNDDGSYKEGGGGYLIYNTKSLGKYCLAVKIDGQI